LETLEEQASIMEQLDLPRQLKMLKKAAANIHKFRKSVTTLGTCYEEERIYDLYMMTKSSLGEFRSVLLYNRNNLMADRIEARLDQATFYAVGAAHLAGNQGILTLLKRKGLSLEPVYN